MSVPVNTAVGQGGTTPFSFVTGASNNAQSIKTANGFVSGVSVWNTTASAEFLKLYDTAGVPNPASDVPKYVIPIPPIGGAVSTFPNMLYFAHGIGLAVVANVSATDNTAVGAGDCVISLGFL